MARTRRLDELCSDVLWQADRQGASLRNEGGRIERAVNQSIAEFREAVSESGHPYYLRSSSGSLAVGVTSPFHFAVLDLSALEPAHHRVYGLDIEVGSEWKSLRPVHFAHRNEGDQTLGEPQVWFEYERSAVAYAPAALSAFPYLLWYLPVHEDLQAGGEFDGLNGGEEWVVFNAVAKLLLRDRDAHLERFQAERSRLLELVLRSAPQRNRSGPIVRQGIGRPSEYRRFAR